MLSIATRIVPVVTLAAAFTVVLGGEAQAQHVHHHGGHHGGIHHGGHIGGGIHQGGIHYGGGHILHPQPYVPSYPTYPNPGLGHQYYDTTHRDYHAPSFQRHGNHNHYRPGHYVVHRTGHWH